MEHRPFVFLVAATDGGGARPRRTDGADSVVVKPANVGQAKTLIERCVRLRLPHRVLVVDDSLTMRSIVRKILVASRFRLELAEAQEGIDALKQIASGKFDLVFLDYNMPGLNGVETLSEIKRQYSGSARRDHDLDAADAWSRSARAAPAPPPSSRSRSIRPISMRSCTASSVCRRSSGLDQSPATKNCQVPSGAMPSR